MSPSGPLSFIACLILTMILASSKAASRQKNKADSENLLQTELIYRSKPKLALAFYANADHSLASSPTSGRETLQDFLQTRAPGFQGVGTTTPSLSTFLFSLYNVSQLILIGRCWR